MEQYITEHITGAAAVVILLLFTLCDISRIPINPWKWIGKGIKALIKEGSDAIFKGIRSDIRGINTRLDKLEINAKIERKRSIRRAVLRFADECRIGTRHSKEMFDNVLTDIDEYYELCKDTDDPNEVIKEAISYIKEINHQCMIDNDYL